MAFCEIEKGINLNIIKTNKFKTITIAILFKQKLDKKTATLNALIPSILYKGCEKYKSIKEMCIKTEEMSGCSFYTDILKKGDYQMIEFLLEFVPSKVQLKDTIQFLSEVILNPLEENGGFKPEYFQLAKQEAIDSIKNRVNDKKEFAKIRTVEEMFKDELFGISADGYLKDFEKNWINEKNLLEHYKKLLKESEIDIIAIGSLEEDNFKNQIKDNFLKKIEGRNFKKTEKDEISKQKTNTNFLTESFNITQGKLCLGFRTDVFADNPIFFALLVGNEILGGSAGSKLFFNVRENKSLCYYVNSFIYIFKGVIFIQSGIDFSQYEETLESIKKEVENIKNGEFGQDDIKNAIISLEKKYTTILDNNVSTMDFNLTNFLTRTNYTVENFIKNVKSVEKEDIIKAFENIWLDTCYFMKGV